MIDLKLKVKVLAVEDEPLLLLIAVDIVEKAGFEAVEANCAAEAITMLETLRGIRILFTDIGHARRNERPDAG